MDELIRCSPVIENGASQSLLQGVRLFKETRHVPKQPMVYSPGLCIVVQGHKIGYLGGHKFRYDASQYLVTSVTMPFECETFASREEPLRGLYIDIDMVQLRELIGQITMHTEAGAGGDRSLPRGIGPASMDAAMLDAIMRLLKCLHAKAEACILGPGLVREILYRALCGAQAPALHARARHSGVFSQVARALEMMQRDYAENLDVEQLAKTAHLSVSAFHRAFKEITSDSPMQYLKKIRLGRAKELMVQERMKAYIAAEKVGYESPSQFSREFKRYFGQSPAELMREARTLQA